MTLQNYTVDVETARELEKNGFGKEACLWWNPNTGELHGHSAMNWSFFIPTYILEQVMEELPEKIDVDRIIFSLITDHHSRCISYEAQGCDGSIQILSDYRVYFDNDKVNIATALAKLWLWAKKNGYIGGGE